MRIKTIKTLFITLLMFLSSVGAWAEEYYNSTLYYQNFEDATNYNLGWTCKGSIAQSDISGNKVLDLIQGGGSGNRDVTGNLAAMSAEFATVTDYSFEFDFGVSSSNTNPSTISLNTTSGVLFTIINDKYSSTSSVIGADGTTLLATITCDAYTKACPKIFNHFKVESNALNGTYLTIADVNGYVVLDKTKISDGLSVLTTFSGSLGRAQPHFAFDNLILRQHVDGAAKPFVELIKVDGTKRIFEFVFNSGETLHYKLPGSDEYLTTTETPCEVTVSESGTLYAYTTKGTATSEVVETIVDATEIVLPTPEIRVGITQDGDKFIPSFGAVCDNSSVLLNPEITISATLDGVNVTSAVVAGNYTPANSGTLTVTATAEGYTSSTTNMFVAAEYSRSWQSVDFSTITIDNVAEYFGDGWSVSANTGRWASWAEQTYSYIEYKTNGGNNITINDRIRMRDVVSVNVGYGLGRNLTDGNKEGIRVLNVKTNEITEFRIYNGYGNRSVSEGSYLSYVVGNGGDAYMYSNNGALLVQASVYTPKADYEIHYTYNSEVVYVEKGRAAKGTVITASKTVEVDEFNKFTVVEEFLPTMTIVDGINLLYVPVRFSGHTKHTNVLYERGTSEETKWTEENLSDFIGNVLTLSDYGASYITNANSGDKSTRIISPTEGAVINVDAYWYGISNTGRAFSAGNGIYFRFGNVFIAQNDQDKMHGYGLNGITNMGSVVKFSGTNAYRNNDISKLKFLHIEMQINTATDMLEYLKVSEEGSNVYLVNVENKRLENADYETIEWGYKKGGSISTERQSYLKSIKVTETVRGLYERGVYTEWSETDLGDNGWKVEVSDKSYPARPSIDENLGLSLLSQVRNQEISYTLPVELSEESGIGITAEWYVGGTTGEFGNKTYFKIGDQIEFSAMPQDQKGAVTINGVEYVVNNACSKDNKNRTDDTWNIKLTLNTATDMITKLSVFGTNGNIKANLNLENIPLGTDASYNTLRLGCVRKASGMYTSLNSILISEEQLRFEHIKTPLSISSAGVSTLCSPYNLDFTDAQNVAAYKAEIDEENGKIRLEKVTTVAAREGVLIRSLSGEAVAEDVPASASAFEVNEGNDFIGTLVNINNQASEDEEYRYYILGGKKNAEGNMVYGFYLAGGKNIGAGKAYLKVPKSAAAKFSFFALEDETTGIEDIHAVQHDDTKVYDLSGRRVVKPSKGLYIKNGKKFIVK